MDLIRRGYHWGWNEPSPPLTFLVPSERDRLCYGREHSNQKGHIRSTSSTLFALPDISCPKERCLPSASNSPGPPERPLHLPQDVHLLIEAPSDPHPRCRHPCHCLLGRFMSLGGLSPRRSRFCREVSSILEELEFLSDIQNYTLAPTNSLSWLGMVRFSELKQ